MQKRPRPIIILLVCLCLLVAWAIYRLETQRQLPPSSSATVLSTNEAATKKSDPPDKQSANDDGATKIFAHNLMLRKGPQFRVYVQWLRGQLTRSHANVVPSFDDPDSFSLDIQNGILRANIGDIGNYFNASSGSGFPLTNVKLSGDADQVKLTGTLHKVIALPIEVMGTISIAPENKILLRVTKINVLKVPFKALLAIFHVKVSDLFKPQPDKGIDVRGSDILLDTQKLLPPPHIRGHLTAVRIVNPDLEEVYGNAAKDVERTEQWRNFLRLRDGTLDFGRLTMHHVDLIMIDVSSDAWFDLDLAHYQEQLVNGYTRMTPQAGLQIFMPDARNITHPKNAQDLSIQWFKDRQSAPPADVIKK